MRSWPEWLYGIQTEGLDLMEVIGIVVLAIVLYLLYAVTRDYDD